MPSIPQDYAEHVYAGILGKIIGVYLGRPFEGWSYERIIAELGEIEYYVHEKLNVPLVVPDDDISGTFAFLRALPDYGYSPEISPAEIGQTWLNYLIEGKTVLWWGGLGNSTEHTAYLRLLQGIPAPQSGSIALNSKVVAEQIGAQIFIDGWAMVAPGDPARAADFARRAASVSHDGEAIYAAQVIAAMEAQAFVESDIQRLLEVGLSFIPRQSVISQLIQDIREWHATEPDWHKTRQRIEAHYGYHKYGGNCHVVPNHALIILALLYGEDDFQKSLLIANTSGWDTDCNSGNVGCLLGIKQGLDAFVGGPDWRGPVADRLYVSTADGGRSITDAVSETYTIVNTGRALAGMKPLAPKNGARFHFELPGSLQGFMLLAPANCVLENILRQNGERCLALRYQQLASPVRLETATFLPPGIRTHGTYALLASPTLYAGQRVRAGIAASHANLAEVTARLYIRYYGHNDELMILYGPDTRLHAQESHELQWLMPDTDGAPIAAIGLELSASEQVKGTFYLDYLTWDGTPDLVLKRPASGGTMWRRAWVEAVDSTESWPEDVYRLIQNRGRGLLIQGTRDWANYQVSATLLPHMFVRAGIGAYVQGMRRYYALLLGNDGYARLVKVLGQEQVLAEQPFIWEQGCAYTLSLHMEGTHIQAFIEGKRIFDVYDAENPLTGGGIALICEEGRMVSQEVILKPILRQ